MLKMDDTLANIEVGLDNCYLMLNRVEQHLEEIQEWLNKAKQKGV